MSAALSLSPPAGWTVHVRLWWRRRVMMTGGLAPARPIRRSGTPGRRRFNRTLSPPKVCTRTCTILVTGYAQEHVQLVVHIYNSCQSVSARCRVPRNQSGGRASATRPRTPQSRMSLDCRAWAGMYCAIHSVAPWRAGQVGGWIMVSIFQHRHARGQNMRNQSLRENILHAGQF